MFIIIYYLLSRVPCLTLMCLSLRTTAQLDHSPFPPGSQTMPNHAKFGNDPSHTLKPARDKPVIAPN